MPKNITINICRNAFLLFKGCMKITHYGLVFVVVFVVAVAEVVVFFVLFL